MLAIALARHQASACQALKAHENRLTAYHSTLHKTVSKPLPWSKDHDLGPYH